MDLIKSVQLIAAIITLMDYSFRIAKFVVESNSN